MLAAEYTEFEAVLKKHAQVYSKKLTDELVEGYWAALKDLSLPTFARCADNHLRYSKFFPKPVELRPKDDAPSNIKEDKDFKAAVAQNIRNWNERLRVDPLHTKWLLLEAYVARVDVTEQPDSPFYAERMTFARDVAQRLIAESGYAYAGMDKRILFAVSRLLGGEIYKQCIQAARQQIEALPA